MFETNREKRSLVSLVLADGSILMASVKLAMSGKLGDVLNNADRFLDILGADGEQYFLSKDRVRQAAICDPPRAGLDLNRRASDGGTFNPWAVLGVAKDATTDEIKSAYRQMVKTYHPDRFANMDLPPEMKEYAAAMLARVNIAHDQVGAVSTPK